ncbi:nuclear body protein SP140 isoform X1 [Podarcis lilfordi]|uniref:Nuclear body protein SP140 isoform X1 n=1 Tax=Podarcis lilfordi TaxID=74358 RepID=A0AA35KBR3_9SAUR|nr:nuclear body protein SP140 isoform X1 [Podarcis lilfordi]
MEGGAGASAPHASAPTSAKAKEGITQNAGNNSTSEANSSEKSTSTDESDPDYSLGNGRTTNAVKRKRKRKHQMQYTERWNGRRIRKVKRRQIQIQEEDLQGSTLLVHCGQVKGVLYKEKLAAGISQKSIKGSDGKWFTPPEFEAEGERESWKSWKRSIRHKGLPLEKLIVSGYLPNPKRIYGKRKKVKNPSTPFCESAQVQSSAVVCHDGPEEATQGPSEEAMPEPSEDATPGPSEETTPVAPQSPGRTPHKHLRVELRRLSPSVLTRARCNPLDSPQTSPPDSPQVSPPDSPQASPPDSLQANPPDSPQANPPPVLRTPHRRCHWRRSMKPHTMSSSLGLAILRSVYKMKRLFQNTFGNRKALQVKLQDINGHLIGLQQQHADLKKALDRCSRLNAALDVLTLQKQMNSIIEHQRRLETLVLEILATLGVERS